MTHASENETLQEGVWWRTNSWHNRLRKLFTRYLKKAGNHLGLVHLSCSVITKKDNFGMGSKFKKYIY